MGLRLVVVVVGEGVDWPLAGRESTGEGVGGGRLETAVVRRELM